MTLARYDTLFEEYLVNISLTKQQANSIDAKLAETLSLFLGAYDGDADIYAQGSFAMGTTVRPLTEHQSVVGNAGEYDVDIVLQRTAWTDARDTLESIRPILESQYGNKVDRKLRESCERVHHETDADTNVDFHVDYVPIKLVDKRKAARRSTNEWFNSDTKKLVEWFAGYSAYYTFLPAIIVMIKRMRDYVGLTDELSSICITALACIYYQNNGSYADDLIGIMRGIIKSFSVPHEQLSIRIDPLEDDLAQNVSHQTQAKILEFFTECEGKLLNAFKYEDMASVQNYLSTSFPSEISKFPENLQSLRSRKWGIELDGSLNVTNIYEDHGKGRSLSRSRRKFFGSGERLIFRANEYDNTRYGIRWQVLNSVSAGPNNRRGKLFEARGANGSEDSSSNKFVNHETEQYNGEHWIKYYVYDKVSMRILEIGRKFFVEVEK